MGDGISISCTRQDRHDVVRYAVQVQAQLKSVPEKLRGYLYSVGSLLAGALLGVIVYGTMYWTS